MGRYKRGWLLTLLFFIGYAAILVAVVILIGCDGLRLAASEAQKKIAFQGAATARAVEAEGTEPFSAAATQLVDATAVSLSYVGLPVNPEIRNYATTVAKAGQDAARRPDLVDVIASADGYFGLVGDLAILFGLGGVGFGGKKLLDWIALARRKAKALQEIIDGNEIFKAEAGGKAVGVFRESHIKKQSKSTAQLVGVLRVEGKD